MKKISPLQSITTAVLLVTAVVAPSTTFAFSRLEAIRDNVSERPRPVVDYLREARQERVEASRERVIQVPPTPAPQVFQNTEWNRSGITTWRDSVVTPYQAPQITSYPTNNFSWELPQYQPIPATPSPALVETNFNVSLEAFQNKQFDGRDFRIGRVLENTDAYTSYYITYKSGDLTISGLMDVPKTGGPFPVIVLNHGYIDPAFYTNGGTLRREQDYLARAGYLVLHSDYRNFAESSKDPNAELNMKLGYAEDVINIVKAVKSSGLSFIDTNRIGMFGHSMGGGLAEIVMTTHPETAKAYVLLAPASSDASENFDRLTVPTRPEEAAQITARYGNIGTNPTFWKGISPINYVSNITAPVMIHQGTADQLVPYQWSQRFASALQAAGKNVTLHLYDGERHIFTTQWEQMMQRTVEFFNARI